jgi:TatD DNase family protein
MLVDSHCHLDYFTAMELPEVLSLPALTEAHPNLWCTIGVHPHHAAEAPIPTPETLAAMARHKRVIGIGESGLDYFYDKSPRDIQADNFRAHIRGARLAGVPLCIHARDADDDIALILKQERDREGGFDFLLHCFSSSRQLAEAALDMGGYISFSGILTFPRSTELRGIAADVPLDRLLVETDAPYLAPVPFRGKRNEPAWVAHTASVLAGLRGLTTDALAELTTRNFRQLFRKAAV